MKDVNKTKKQLIDELVELHQRIAELEKSETRRKSAKKVIKESEKLYRNLVEAFPAAIILMDLNNNITLINQQGLKLFGYESAEEVIGKSALDFIATEERHRALADMRKMLETGIVRNVEYTMLRKDGTPFTAELSGSLIVDEGKKPKAFIVVARDITKRKRLEEILKKEQQELKLIIDSSPIIVFYKDKGGKFIRVNKTFAKALKVPEEEFVGKTVFDFYSAKIAQGMTDDDQEVLKSGFPKLNIIEQYESASGIRWVQTDKIPICDKNGIPVGLIGFAQDITERKQAGEALIQAHRNWEEIFQAIGHPTLILDSEHNILLANRAVVNATGRTEEELRGKKCYEVFHGTNQPPENCPLEKMLSSGSLEVVEMEMEALGGVFLVSCTPVFDDRGNLQKIIHIATNITERKKAQEALQKSEALLKETQQISKVGGWELDVETGKITWTEEVYRIYGVSPDKYDPDDVKQDIEFYAPEERAVIEQAFHQAVNEGKPYDLELKFHNAQGEALWVRTIGQTEMKDGKAVRVFGNIIDITERKQAEEALRKSEEKYRLVTENIPVAVYSALPDEHSTNLFVTGKLEELMGYSEKAFLENPELWGNIIHPEDKEQVWQTIEHHRQQKSLLDIEYRIIMPDQSIKWIRDKATPVLDVEGNVARIDGFMEDITERKRAEEKLKKSYEQLHKLAAHLQSIREEERTEIARDIHDELSQTLTGLKFDLSWLHNKILRAEDGASLVEKINSMSHILDNTIQWARRISMSLRPSVLDDLGLVATLEWQANEFQTRTGIACIFTSFKESFFLDREKSTVLFRICQESLTNVARHSNAKAVTINLKEDGDNLILEVSDNGKGITETQITDTKSLGLLGMKERALILNGEFTVSGIPGKGTTVTVKIPKKE